MEHFDIISVSPITKIYYHVAISLSGIERCYFRQNHLIFKCETDAGAVLSGNLSQRLKIISKYM